MEAIINETKTGSVSEAIKHIITTEISKQEALENLTAHIQNDCHKFVESMPNVNYQDATNTYLFTKLAELTLKL